MNAFLKAYNILKETHSFLKFKFMSTVLIDFELKKSTETFDQGY